MQFPVHQACSKNLGAKIIASRIFLKSTTTLSLKSDPKKNCLVQSLQVKSKFKKVNTVCYESSLERSHTKSC